MNLKEVLLQIQGPERRGPGYFEAVSVYAVACAHELGVTVSDLTYLRIAIPSYLNPDDFHMLPLMDFRQQESLLVAVIFACRGIIDEKVVSPTTTAAFKKIEPLIQPIR